MGLSMSGLSTVFQTYLKLYFKYLKYKAKIMQDFISTFGQ